MPTIIAPRIPPQKKPSPPLAIAPITAHIKVAIQKAGHPLFFSLFEELDEEPYDDEELEVVVRVVVAVRGVDTLGVDGGGVET